MDAELKALRQCNTWCLVTPPPNATIVGSKWVFVIKRNTNGEVVRYKAGLVAKGFHQTGGIDYEHIYSPVIRPSFVRVVLTLVITQG